MPKSHRLDHKPYLVPPGKKIRLKDYDPAYTAGFEDKNAAKAALLEDVSELAQMQDIFWASKQYALIIIFQALDAAGKDSTITRAGEHARAEVLSACFSRGTATTIFEAIGRPGKELEVFAR
jgi:polyphosphate kinase 2 (PPK2 family)